MDLRGLENNRPLRRTWRLATSFTYGGQGKFKRLGERSADIAVSMAKPRKGSSSD